MAATHSELEPVASRIEPSLRRLLTEKRTLAGRSEAAEIKQAIQAWVLSPELIAPAVVDGPADKAVAA